MKRLPLVAACLTAMALAHAACLSLGDQGRAEGDAMNQLAERYVKLVLALGQHDKDYVDAYYGPPEWRKEAETGKRPLDQINTEAMALEQSLASAVPAATVEEILRLRHTYLTKQVSALRTRVAMLSGRTLSFDEESKALYDAVAPTNDPAAFERTVEELGKRLPGSGSVLERYDAFRSRFAIPAINPFERHTTSG